MLSPVFPTSAMNTACDLPQEILGKIGGGYAGYPHTPLDLQAHHRPRQAREDGFGSCMDAVQPPFHQLK